MNAISLVGWRLLKNIVTIIKIAVIDCNINITMSKTELFSQTCDCFPINHGEYCANTFSTRFRNLCTFIVLLSVLTGAFAELVTPKQAADDLKADTPQQLKLIFKWPVIVYETNNTIVIPLKELKSYLDLSVAQTKASESESPSGPKSDQGAKQFDAESSNPVSNYYVSDLRLKIDGKYQNVIKHPELRSADKIQLVFYLDVPNDTKLNGAEGQQNLENRRSWLKNTSYFGLIGKNLSVDAYIDFKSADKSDIDQPYRTVHFAKEYIVRPTAYWVLILVSILIIVVVLLCVYTYRNTRLLYDRDPIMRIEDGVNKPVRLRFSLARVQGFAWLGVVYFAMLLSYATTGSLDHLINSTGLGLLAIGCGTSFVGLLIDGKPTPDVVGTTSRPDVNRPSMKNLLLDLLDSGEDGNLHRLQIIAWTIALICLYLHQLFTNLDLPVFNDTMFGLLGVSSGTYLAFKAKEK